MQYPQESPRFSNRSKKPYQSQEGGQRRPRFEVAPHSGPCTAAEVTCLRNCTLRGDKPYANLIAAGYAKENEDTGDWYLTDTGFEKIREFTVRNPSGNAGH